MTKVVVFAKSCLKNGTKAMILILIMLTSNVGHVSSQKMLEALQVSG
ncbi:hypothetical protein [Leuconostoc gasicomitatum]|nr:hypothetical protein [Leuconostoc gasicomitatum]MBZ5960772.1 hypothetical protein [Leuconostoc gasicomitatum]MBZ5984113.1 hypothetical protein [Leuconostoc gasicomitatum]MBZ5994779.1 hypothetical protein [Leuconostoc gasicomitatum]MBZ5998169.1 hypothetical protein [Leuconostoc gasicomitatum]